MTEVDWCARWGCALLDEIPFPGLATARDGENVVEELRKWPGRNHPRAGRWLWERYAGIEIESADPMYGAGALWAAMLCAPLQFNEVERAVVPCCDHADARSWSPPRSPVDFTMFSPPFLQNHSAGKTAYQVALRDRKGLHAMQQFGAAPGNLGSMKEAEFWPAMAAVYRQVRTYTSGTMVVILRNRIKKGVEVDVVGRHVAEIRWAGWRVEGAHPRALRPTGYQQFKVARDPNTPWIRTEWAVVARPA